MVEVTRLVTIIDACDDGKNLCDDGTCSSLDCAEREALLYADQAPPDTEPPAITLRGDDHVRVTYGNPVEGLSLAPCASAAEPANATCYAHAVDSQDGDVSAALTLAQAEGESPLCAWEQALGATCYPGSYTYVYQVEDAAGNVAATQVLVELVEAQVVATEASEVEALAAEFGVLLEESASSGEDGSPAALGGYLEAAAAAQEVTLASDVEGLSQNVTTAALSGEVDGVAAMHASLVAELEGVSASLAETAGTADDVERLVEESEEGPADGENALQARVQDTWSSGYGSEAANIEAFSTSLEQALENADKALAALATMERELQEAENSGAAEAQRNINELEASLLNLTNYTLLSPDIAPPPPQGEPDCSNVIQDRLEFHFTLGSSQLPSTPPPPPPPPTPSTLPSPPSSRRLLARGGSSTTKTSASESSTEAGDGASEGDELVAYQGEFNTTLTDQRAVAIRNQLLKGIILTTTRRSTKRCTDRFPQLADWNGVCYAGPLDAEVYGTDAVYNPYSDLFDPGLLDQEEAYYNLTTQST
eukprot:gene8959-10614_t